MGRFGRLERSEGWEGLGGGLKVGRLERVGRLEGWERVQRLGKGWGWLGRALVRKVRVAKPKG